MNSASVIVVAFLAIIVIGPSKLPAGAEAIWLALTNLANAQKGLPAIDLQQARRIWQARNSPIFSLINLLYAAAEHLEELRRRLMITAGIFVVGVVIAGIFADWLLDFIRRPAGDIELIFIRPPEMFLAYFNLMITTGVLFTVPVAIYQLILFIAPALETETELKAFRLIRWFGFPMVLLLFVAGAYFAYGVTLPVALRYFATFGGDAVTAQWTISEYLRFVLSIIIWVGIGFEMPLVVMLLARFGVVTAQTLARGWRVAFLLTAIFAAVITPTPDPLNMAIVWLPLFALYLLGVLLARIFGKRPEPAPES
jgi:sec-independent protein translocase protein TatC